MNWVKPLVQAAFWWHWRREMFRLGKKAERLCPDELASQSLQHLYSKAHQ